MEGAGQLDRGCQRGEARDLEFGAQRGDLVVDTVAAGIADEFGPADVDGGSAQVETDQELVGEVDFCGGLVGGVERDGECAQGLAVGGLAGLAVLFGFGASGEVRRSGALGSALESVHRSDRRPAMALGMIGPTECAPIAPALETVGACR